MAPGERIGVAELGEGLRVSVGSEGWEQALLAWATRELEGEGGDLHGRARERFDRILLEAALAASEGHRGQAAEKLGLGRNTLTRKLGASRTRRRRDTPGG